MGKLFASITINAACVLYVVLMVFLIITGAVLSVLFSASNWMKGIIWGAK